MAAPDRRRFPEAFHDRVEHWSYARWLLVVVVISVVVTLISAVVRAW